jgi:hypothetical protein
MLLRFFVLYVLDSAYVVVLYLYSFFLLSTSCVDGCFNNFADSKKISMQKTIKKNEFKRVND